MKTCLTLANLFSTERNTILGSSLGRQQYLIQFNNSVFSAYLFFTVTLFGAGDTALLFTIRV